MNIISWNLNGLLANVKNETFDVFYDMIPEVLCFQETKTWQEPEILPGYRHFWNHAERNGYAGTVALVAPEVEVVSIRNTIGEDAGVNREGRVITLELPDFFIVNTYAPNSQKDLARKKYRLEWDEAYMEHLFSLKKEKPVIACGDYNATLSELDTFEENLRQHWAQQGYASDERSNLFTVLENGFTDAFRSFYPQERNCFTWWSNRLKKREENRGWRLDYFFVSDELMPQVKKVVHHTDIMGSDHCPIGLEVV
ncbi:MAG: exodeoxyribonuclease III [Lachnospiraceae bacterium]|nr:exodeoxyribonuclease III [Lachnospiraceae bacterium]